MGNFRASLASLIIQPKNIKPRKVVRVLPEHWRETGGRPPRPTQYIVRWIGEQLSITYYHYLWNHLVEPPEDYVEFHSYDYSGDGINEKAEEFYNQRVISPSNISPLQWVVMTNCKKVYIENSKGEVILDYTDETV